MKGSSCSSEKKHEALMMIMMRTKAASLAVCKSERGWWAIVWSNWLNNKYGLNYKIILSAQNCFKTGQNDSKQLKLGQKG